MRPEHFYVELPNHLALGIVEILLDAGRVRVCTATSRSTDVYVGFDIHYNKVTIRDARGKNPACPVWSLDKFMDRYSRAD